MSTDTLPADDAVPLNQVERELARRLGEGRSDTHEPWQRARLSNLVIYCNKPEQAEAIASIVPDIVAIHPARVLLCLADPGSDAALRAYVKVWSPMGRQQQNICSEQVTLKVGGQYSDRLPFAVRELLIGDLPTNLWWAAAVPPPLAGHLLFDLAERAQQIIYDSIGWTEPARGVAATSAWLAKFERGGQLGWRVASDLNWRRLKFWRRLVSQALDPNTAPTALETIQEVLVEHGPHAVIQAWELMSWMASCLGWKVQMGNVQPGVEIAWQVVAPHGLFKVRIRRLADGPSEVRCVHLTCGVRDTQQTYTMAVQKDMRLAVVLEGMETVPRTLAVPAPTLAELVAQQLSNRERDPRFTESMAVAEVFARSVLG
jgi:glucose-6-phosphate dehydrogenase assembly protein OpcA